MKNKLLVFLLGSAAAVAALAVYGYRHIDDFLPDDGCDGDCDNCECMGCPGCDGCFEDKEIADEYDDDDDVACQGNCEECDLCSNGAAFVIPDVSGISAGYEA